MSLKYITFDQLMASVESDMESYTDNGMIDRGKAIKIVRKVNNDIGLKINKEHSAMVEICNFKGDLPLDFLYLQMAVACTIEHAYIGPGTVYGTHTIETNVPVTTYSSQGACLNECGGCYWVTQQFKDKMIKYEKLTPLKLSKRAMSLCTENCVNFNWNTAAYDIDIENGQIITGFREGKIYINYLSDMVDEEGNLLLLDHPLTTEYYEYAVKKHYLENFMMNNDAEVAQKLGYIKEELRLARIRALNFTDTPEYSEIANVYEVNRRAFYNKYHRIIQ